MANDLTTLTDKQIIEFLNERNSQYDKIARRVKVYLDCYYAEREDLLGNATPSVNDINAASGTDYSGSGSTYLQKGAAESQSDYEIRLRETEAFMMTPRVVSHLVGSIYNPMPSYTVDNVVEDLMADANKYHQKYQQAMIHNCIMTLVCGFTVGVVDSNRTIDTPEMNRQQAKKAGIRPLFNTYTPQNIMDWDFDDSGLAWVHVAEKRSHRSSFFEKRKEQTVHIIVDRNAIYQYAINDNKLERIGEAPHGMSKTPAVFNYFAREREDMPQGVGQSYIKGTCRADIAGLRAESYRAITLQIHGTPHLWRRMSEQEWNMMVELHAQMQSKLKNPTAMDYKFVSEQMQVGLTGYHVLSGDNSEMGYTTLDATGLDKFREARNDAREAALEFAGFDPATVLSSGKQATVQSGVSKALGYQIGQGTQVSFLSKCMADFDLEILKLYSEKAGVLNVDAVNVDYPEPQISSPTESLIGENEIVEDWTELPITQRMCRKSLIQRFKLFKALPLEEQQEVIDEIDAMETEADALSKEMLDDENVQADEQSEENNKSENDKQE